MKYLANDKGFFSILGILLALALLFFGAYYMINVYFGKGPGGGVSAGSASSGEPASNYQSVIQSTKDNINKMNSKTMEQLQQVDELKK